MRQKLYNISDKIDGLTLEILKKIKGMTEELKIDFFLVGATVRDMILNYVYNIRVYRATNDIDFAVRVRGWDEYYKLVSEVERNGFRKDERIPHRYYYDGLIIDFIPFGEIEDKDNTITWQDNDKKNMNVIGFDDAFKNTEDVLVQKSPDIFIRTASVEGLVLLKLFSWNDRAVELRSKDAKDLYLIITTYLYAGNDERLYEHQDIVDMAVDYELSGAILLGKDIANTVSEKVHVALLRVLSDEKVQLLAYDMSKYENLHRDSDDEKVEWCIQILNALKWGLVSRVS